MPERPNIVMILVDELRADMLGCFGHPVVRTPHLDRLAGDGCRFDQCMIPQPTCTPCRASLLTGCFPSALRSRMVGCRTPDDARFLPRILKRAGYRTASVGKIHLVPQGEEPEAVLATRGADGVSDYYGFEHVDLVNGHGDHCFGPEYTPWLRERVPDLEGRRGQREPLCRLPNCYRWPLPPEVHSSRYIADRASAYIRQAAGEEAPFFLHCSFPDPHHPFTVPEPYASQYDPAAMAAPLPPITECADPPAAGLDAYHGRVSSLKKPGGQPVDHVIGTPAQPYSTYTEEDWRVVRAVTAGMVSLLDESVGTILEALEASGLADNTVVVFASDHGDYLGDYGLFGKGLHYDCVLRTPLMMRGPGLPAGKTIDRIASLVDVAPTLLELAAVVEPDAMQGVSMLSGMRDESRWLRDAALTENDDDMAGLRLRTLTTHDWKFTLYAGLDYGELYDRRNDPAERVNLWNHAEWAETKGRLLRHLADHMLCAVDGANGRVQQPAPPVKKHAPAPLDVEKDEPHA